MKLQKMRLHSFAGIDDRTYEFSPGMNVVLGPNEVGKSTMVNGILCALFESISYGKVHWRKHLQQFIPRKGGDTFEVSLDCMAGGASYQITKSWGGECRCELTLPSGEVIRSVDDVDQQVASLLRLKRGTWQNILIADQSAVSSTLKDFDTSGEEASELAQILRSSTFDTDGVSIEKLDRAINEQFDVVSSRWELDAERPENGRGIENPWKQGVGTLLKTWYEHERLKNEHRRVEDYERNLDDINQRMTALIAERKELELYVDKFKPVIDGVKERQGLELKLNAAQKNEKRLRDVQSKWPQHQADLNRLKESLKDLADKHTALREELGQAQLFQEFAVQRKKLAEAKAAEGKLAEAAKHIERFQDLSTELFQDLNATVVERDRHAASMAAGKLQIRFIPESDTKVSIKSGLKQSREEIVTKAHPLHTEADGMVTLTSDQFRLEVESGDGQFSAVREKYESAQVKIRDLLSTIEVGSLSEASKRETDYTNAETNRERAKTALETILNGQTLAELESSCGEDVSAPNREIAEINIAILDNREKYNRQQDDFEAKRSSIKYWENEFKTQDAVLDDLIDARTTSKDCEKQLEKLAPLPDDIDNLEGLENEFKRRHSRLTEIKEGELPDARTQQSMLNATEPDRTTQELRDLITEARSSYSLEKRRLESLVRVKEAFQQMKDRLDSGTLDPWMQRLSQTIQQVTSDQYMELDFDGGGASRSSGLVIPHELLSMGTKASMGFSIRLSMASHFLQDLDGFLILDDPMVDLDAERQRKTADVLREFAEQKQVILLTCHEAHAALLTETPLRITREGES